METLTETYEIEDIGIRTIDPNDVCDICRMRAKLLAVSSSGHDLVFCRHHGRLHEKTLKAQGFNVLWADED
jgi:hypothetical protein